MNTRPLISLVFVNYRSVWQLSSALRSLFEKEKDFSSFEVIVVNNYESEGRVLCELAKKLPIVIQNRERNDGYGTAANEGARLAQGEIVGFLNPDVEWLSPLLGGVRDFYRLNGSGVLGLSLCDESGERERFAGGKAPSLLEIVKNKLWPQRFRADSDVVVYDWVSGGAIFLKKSDFESLQGFDEQFFLYFEDADLCVRAKMRGISIALDPSLQLKHKGGKSFRTVSEQKKHYYASQVRYFSKHRPFLEAVLLRFLHGFFQIFRI